MVTVDEVMVVGVRLLAPVTVIRPLGEMATAPAEELVPAQAKEVS